MAAEPERPLQNTWQSRNKVVKIFKTSGRFGWMHLIIGENKESKRRFLRLKRYLNWFSIPDERSLKVVQSMLKKGAEELGWNPEEDSIKVTIDIKKDKSLEKEDPKEGIPDEILDFIKAHPEFTRQLIKTNLENPNDFFELFQIIDASLKESGDRLKVAFKEVVKKISKQDAKGMQELSDLMGKWKLHQITSLATLIQSRLDTITNFEEIIHDEGTYEIEGDNSVHRVLEKSMWLIDEDYWIVQSNKSLRTFIGDEILKSDSKHKSKRPDFACATYQNKLIIIEIKRPKIELTKQELDQAELYLRIIDKYKAEKYTSVDVYLVGNKISSEAREVVQHRKSVYIKTYSDILDACRKRYQEYLKIVED